MPTLNWIGKEKVVNHHAEVPFRVLECKYGFRAERPDDRTQTNSGNKIIHGDNLEALKALLPEYEGKIDCIYIDPPYNTGNEGWVYNDNVNDPQLRRWLGEVVGAEGEDFTRHDKWACMIYPRLRLMRQLLSDSGVIFISNDDNEQKTLKAICDEIFGSACFVSNIIWQRNYSTGHDSHSIPTATDYITVYSKKAGWNPNKLERTEEMNAVYKNPDNDYVPWTSDNPCAPGAATHQGMVYAIQHPFTGELLYPTNGRCWTFGQEQMLDYMNGWCEYELRDINDAEQRAAVCGIPANEVRPDVKAIMLKESEETSRAKAEEVLKRGQWPKFYFTKNGQGGMRRKTYLNAVEGRLVTNFWPHSEVGHTDAAKKELKRIFGGKIPFDTPKPSSLVERIVEIATNEGSTVLDCFAGSGTTAHAVLERNRKDNGRRRFILVEMLDYADSVTAERVRRVMSGYAYKGKTEEDIFSRKLTPKNLAQGAELLRQATTIAEMYSDKYDKVGKPRIVDDCLKVTATKIHAGRMEGLGGAFDYYELGPALFDAEGNINEQVGEEKLRAYIYYTETRQPLARRQEPDSPYLLDYLDGTGYFFYYRRGELTTLSHDTLSMVTRKAEHYVIYADTCTIDKE